MVTSTGEFYRENDSRIDIWAPDDYGKVLDECHN